MHDVGWVLRVRGRVLRVKFECAEAERALRDKWCLFHHKVIITLSVLWKKSIQRASDYGYVGVEYCLSLHDVWLFTFPILTLQAR